jgi:hypothetical protein
MLKPLYLKGERSQINELGCDEPQNTVKKAREILNESGSCLMNSIYITPLNIYAFCYIWRNISSWMT